MECTEDGCEDEAVVQVYVPWADDRVVCAPHARSIASQDGVVAAPLEGTEDAWP